jgi:hypothetical protein
MADERTPRWLTFVLAIFWWVFVPITFALLYTVIELQGAARIAGKTSLATNEVSSRADELERAEKRLDVLDKQLSEARQEQDKATDGYELAGNETATLAQTLLLRISENENGMPICEGADGMSDCLAKVLPIMSKAPWNTDPVAQDLLRDLQSSNLKYHSAVADSDRMDRRCLDVAREMESARALLADRSASEANANSACMRTIGGSTSMGATATAPLAEPIETVYAVANNLKKIRGYVPAVGVLFLLPSGVVVAFFTGLMGALGGAITSLMRVLRKTTDGDKMWKLYGVNPIMGALAGFTVYFVVSAGAVFFVQPGWAETAQAENQLSPAALALLGLFAGLAGGKTMDWLIEKAEALFAPNGNKPKSDAGGGKPAQITQDS